MHSNLNIPMELLCSRQRNGAAPTSSDSSVKQHIGNSQRAALLPHRRGKHTKQSRTKHMHMPLHVGCISQGRSKHVELLTYLETERRKLLAEDKHWFPTNSQDQERLRPACRSS